MWLETALKQRFKKTAICHYCHYFDYTFTDGESQNVTPLLELTSKKGCPSMDPLVIPCQWCVKKKDGSVIYGVFN